MSRGRAVGYRYWTDEETAVVRERYLLDDPADIAARLGRTRSCIMQKACKLGIATIRKTWSAADLRILRNLWLEGSLTAIAVRLGRTKMSVYEKGQRIGLQVGAPPGWEYLDGAASRTGYHRDQISMIMKWAGMPVRRAMARPTKGAAYRRRIVDPGDVDTAIERWLATETPSAAARARGIHPATLARKLKGVIGLPPKPTGKTHWRIPSDLIDQAVGELQDRRRAA